MTTSAPVAPEPAGVSSPRAAHFGWAVTALTMGGFVIGTTEFVTMGLLPQIAEGVSVTIPQAGHIISAYALGVVVGAPVLAFAGVRLPRRGLLLMLVAALAVFNAASATALDFRMLTAARFLTGLPHGIYFGVASLVAASMAPPGRQGRAVALTMLGIPIANVVGVPLATWIGQHWGWRVAYGLVVLLAVITFVCIASFVPSAPGNPHATGRGELTAFRNPQVILTLLAGAIGFGGMFALYSYIAPTVTEVCGLAQGAVPVFLLAFGLGGVAGTWLGGVLADWSVFGTLLGASVAMSLTLLLFAATTPYGWWSLPVLFLIAVVTSALVVNLQLRLMQVAGEAQVLGAAMNHASLNIANAMGAWVGGLVIAAGYGYRAPAVVGATFSMAGLGILLLSAVLHARGPARPVSPPAAARPRVGQND